MHRTWGGLVAGGLFVLPSFFILVGLAWVYMAYGTIPAVAGLLYGIKPAVVAIVLFAAYRIGLKALKKAYCGRFQHWPSLQYLLLNCLSPRLY
jgi:chromate transporter